MSPTRDRIDAHHHLWKYSKEQYPWMLAGMESIRRDFLVPDLEHTLRGAGFEGAVTVQARQSVEETEWLIELASANSIIRAVVGWVPIIHPELRGLLEKYSAHPKLKAVRHVLHDEPDPVYMLRNDFQAGVSMLKDFGLRYDLLIFERHLPQTIKLVDSHPNQVFVVDHIAKPKIQAGLISPWRERLQDLARRPNVYCKLSGMVTEANWASWNESDLHPYIEIVLECFGPDRVMFGSDWPVCLVATDYKRWVRVVERAISELSASEQDDIFGRTAERAYGF